MEFFLMTWNFWKVIWIKKRKKLLYLEWRDWKIIQFLQWKFCIVKLSFGQIYWKVRRKIHHCRYQATVAELLTTFKRKKKNAKIPLKPLNLEHMMYIHQTGISSKSCVLLMSLVMPTHLKLPWSHQILKRRRVKRSCHQRKKNSLRKQNYGKH